MSKAKRRAQAARRAQFAHRDGVAKLLSTCLNCGQPGAHYVPPCFGDPGFYTCAPVALGLDPSMGPDARLTAAHILPDGSIKIIVDGISPALIHDLTFKGEHYSIAPPKGTP